MMGMVIKIQNEIIQLVLLDGPVTVEVIKPQDMMSDIKIGQTYKLRKKRDDYEIIFTKGGGENCKFQKK